MRHNKPGGSQPAALQDINPAFQNYEGAGRDLARRDEAFARGIGFAPAKPRQAIELRRFQHGKHLIASGFDQRM